MPGDAAPGKVLIDVLESGRPEHYWQYEIQPTLGLVRKVREETFQDYKHESIPHVSHQSTGTIYACYQRPEASSPDGRYLAYCWSAGTSNLSEFFVVDARTSRELFHWRPNEWRDIRGFSWAPNSRSVAFLNISSYYGKTPLESLSKHSGHPVPHNTIYLDFLNLQTLRVTEYLVQSDVPYSFSRILDWSQ